MSALVSAEWLSGHLQAPDIRLVDATWFLPAIDRDPKAEFTDNHIPGAVFFDIEDIADDQSPLPHMVPSAAKFASRVRKLGLGDGNRIIIYDNNRLCASARVWWMFRLFGHNDVAVLDGGLTAWIDSGLPLDSFPKQSTERHFTPRMNNILLRDLDAIRANITTKREQLVDVRSAGRFTGVEPEPRPELRQGHIPNSVNLPFGSLLDENGKIKDRNVLLQIFGDAGVDLDKPITTTCGSGVTAAIAALALFELGVQRVAVYDGSWSEWGGRPDTPVAR